jgi:N-acetylneuraminic acid mutarotase
MVKLQIISILLIIVLFSSTIGVSENVKIENRGSWVTKTPMPTKRTNMTGGDVVVNGKIYAIGGSNGKGTGPGGVHYSTNEEYDPQTDKWNTKPSMTYPRDGYSPGITDNKYLFIIGGETLFAGTPAVHHTNERYDSSTNQWKTMKAGLQIARTQSAQGTITDGTSKYIYIVGGRRDIYSVYKDMEIYDTVKDKMSMSSTPIPTARFGAHSCVVNNKLYVIGGIKYSSVSGKHTVVATNEVFIKGSNPNTGKWETKKSMPIPVAFGACAVVDTRIFIFGGVDGFPNGNCLNSTFVYDTSTDTWTQDTPMPTKRQCAAAATVNNKIYVFGGMDVQGNPLNVNEEYTPPIISEYSVVIIPIVSIVAIMYHIRKKKCHKTNFD